MWYLLFCKWLGDNVEFFGCSVMLIMLFFDLRMTGVFQFLRKLARFNIYFLFLILILEK